MANLDKFFTLTVVRSHYLDADQAYVVGNFLVVAVRDAPWWERLFWQARGLLIRTKPKTVPDTVPDTNETIGIKITTDHYAKLLGMVRPHCEAGIAQIKLVPSPKCDQVVSAPTQD